MSQQDDDDIKTQLQKTEAARAKSFREWQRLDAVLFNPDIQQGKKLYLLGHLRTAHSATGLMYGAASRLARAMSVKPQAAERMQRTLREEEVLTLVDRKEGKTNTVLIAPAWVAKVEAEYLEWKSGAPHPSEAGVKNLGQAPSLEGWGTPSLEGGRPPPWKEGYPLIDPPISSSDSGQPTVDPATNHKTVPASDSINPKSREGVELQMQEPEVVEFTGDIPWVEPAQIPPTYAQAVWFDRSKGKLFLVSSQGGRDFYREQLKDFGCWTVIRDAMIEASDKAPPAKARNGGLESLVRKYCGYALERQNRNQQRSQARETAFQRPRAFQP